MVGVSLREIAPKKWELGFAMNADVKHVIAQGEKIRYSGRSKNIEQDWLQLPATGLAVGRRRSQVLQHAAQADLPADEHQPVLRHRPVVPGGQEHLGPRRPAHDPG